MKKSKKIFRFLMVFLLLFILVFVTAFSVSADSFFRGQSLPDAEGSVESYEAIMPLNVEYYNGTRLDDVLSLTAGVLPFSSTYSYSGQYSSGSFSRVLTTDISTEYYISSIRITGAGKLKRLSSDWIYADLDDMPVFTSRLNDNVGGTTWYVPFSYDICYYDADTKEFSYFSGSQTAFYSSAWVMYGLRKSQIVSIMENAGFSSDDYAFNNMVCYRFAYDFAETASITICDFRGNCLISGNRASLRSSYFDNFVGGISAEPLRSDWLNWLIESPAAFLKTDFIFGLSLGDFLLIVIGFLVFLGFVRIFLHF